MAGIGLIACDNTGGFRGAKAICLKANDAEQAESLAVLEAILWAQEMQMSEVADAIAKYARSNLYDGSWEKFASAVIPGQIDKSVV
ncbi:hypothetical protein BVC80_9089g70 [Macleaya cordata]|uniref:RNase H type-1 domain-containing protein n=1 Tax=Macleaya cordata TaxID=56857 RepID=A0A200PQH3_MACCD|nr:hypothetical protein BVC80_9089g70 [Macleaya cordata]